MKRGYTLFELLVSISIIAILVALATTSYSAAQKKARDAKRMEDMETIRKAAEQFYMLNNSTYCGTVSMNWQAGQTWTIGGQVIMQNTPQDPKSGSTYSYRSCDTTSYCVCATLENAVGNSSNSTCTGWVNGTGQYYCVSNQQ